MLCRPTIPSFFRAETWNTYIYFFGLINYSILCVLIFLFFLPHIFLKTKTSHWHALKHELWQFFSRRLVTGQRLFLLIGEGICRGDGIGDGILCGDRIPDGEGMLRGPALSWDKKESETDERLRWTTADGSNKLITCLSTLGVGDVIIAIQKIGTETIWASSRENLSSGFATRVDKLAAQLQRLARVLKFRL